MLKRRDAKWALKKYFITLKNLWNFSKANCSSYICMYTHYTTWGLREIEKNETYLRFMQLKGRQFIYPVCKEKFNWILILMLIN